MFSGYSRWTTAGKNKKTNQKKPKRNQARSLFSLHHHSQHNLLTFSHLIAFPFLATNSATLYFHHLTHIQNCFLVGAAPETKSKPLIQLQIIGWKAVTSALDRTASHGSSSSPSLDGTLFLFFYFNHIHKSFVIWWAHFAFSPAMELAFMWTQTPQVKHNSGKINSK